MIPLSVGQALDKIEPRSRPGEKWIAPSPQETGISYPRRAKSWRHKGLLGEDCSLPCGAHFVTRVDSKLQNLDLTFLNAGIMRNDKPCLMSALLSWDSLSTKQRPTVSTKNKVFPILLRSYRWLCLLCVSHLYSSIERFLKRIISGGIITLYSSKSVAEN